MYYETSEVVRTETLGSRLSARSKPNGLATSLVVVPSVLSWSDTAEGVSACRHSLFNGYKALSV